MTGLESVTDQLAGSSLATRPFLLELISATEECHIGRWTFMAHGVSCLCDNWKPLTDN